MNSPVAYRNVFAAGLVHTLTLRESSWILKSSRSLGSFNVAFGKVLEVSSSILEIRSSSLICNIAQNAHLFLGCPIVQIFHLS